MDLCLLRGRSIELTPKSHRPLARQFEYHFAARVFPFAHSDRDLAVFGGGLDRRLPVLSATADKQRQLRASQFGVRTHALVPDASWDGFEKEVCFHEDEVRSP